MKPSRPDKPKSAAKVRPARSTSDNAGAIRMVAAIHERAGAALVAVAATDAASPFRLGEARRFSPAEQAALRGFLKEQAVDLVIRVAPAAQSLARTATLPEGVTDGAALAEALALIAESELPAQLPWYRRTGGRVRLTPAASEPATGLLVGWHRPEAGFQDPLAASVEGFRQLWTTESVGLAGLMPGVADAAPSAARWIASIDQGAGVLVLLAIHGAKSAARVLRLPTDEARRAAATDANIRETLASLGVEAPAAVRLDPSHTIHASDGASRPVVAGQPRDRAWADQFAIAASLLEAFSDPDPARRSLFNLHATEPRQRLGLLQGVMTWLSVPSRAAAVIALCLAAMLLVPLGVAYARSALLREQVAAIPGLDDRLNDEEQRVGFYALLRERRWPMTKLMADIATSTPEGITLDVLELNQGEAITLRGTAKTSDLVIRLRENLAKTRVFESISTPNVGSSSEGVQFQLQARVSPAGAVYRGDLIDDFARNPLGKRLYGDEYVPAAPARDGASSAAEGGGRDASSTRPYPGTPAPIPPSGPPRSVAGGEPASIPAALSDDEIAKMERGAAVLAWAKRKGAINRVSDEAVKARLIAEVEKLAKRRDEIDGKGGGQ